MSSTEAGSDSNQSVGADTTLYDHVDRDATARLGDPVSPRAGAVWLILVAGTVGFFAAATLTIEKFNLLNNPAHQPSCNLSPILSCGSVMQTWQASLFGFPNPLIGIAAFTVVVTLAVLAIAGIGFPRWVWGGLSMGSALGMLFIGWLIFQSIYRIDTLCPYCMAVWTVTSLILLPAMNLFAGEHGILRLVANWRWLLATLFYATVIAMAYFHFEDRWLNMLSS